MDVIAHSSPKYSVTYLLWLHALHNIHRTGLSANGRTDYTTPNHNLIDYMVMVRGPIKPVSPITPIVRCIIIY